MTNPTSSFGWQMPTNTDLVTDLPADFEVFGQAVDTSMADLLGGTTGQILAKNSNTNMDFVWIANDQGDITGITATSPLTGGGTSGAITMGILSGTTSNLGAVQLSTSTSSTSTSLAATASAVKDAYDLAAAAVPKSTVTAKGSIFTATASATPAEITVGSNGLALMADSTATTGLRWTATPNASNVLLNSAFQIWQRATSFSIPANTSTYSADRWTSYRTATGSTVSRQVTNDTTNLAGVQYCARVQRDSGNTSTAIMYFTQAVESVNTIPLANQRITYSFWARAGANYSAASSVLTSTMTSGTGTDQPPYAGYTGSTNFATGSHTLTTTWTRFTVTGDVPNNASEMLIQFTNTPVGTAGVNDYYEVTGVMINIGSMALPFRTYSQTIAGELAACQRYYFRNTAANNSASFFMNGFAASTTVWYGVYTLPVTMRTKPTLETSGTASNYRVYHGPSGFITLSTVPAIDQANENTVSISSSVAAGLTAYGGLALAANSTTSAYLGFTAEL